MSHQPISLHRAVRHETRTQTAVAALLATGGPRYQAAVELQQATDQLREAARLGLATNTMRWRLNCAEAVWDTLRIADWRVTPPSVHAACGLKTWDAPDLQPGDHVCVCDQDDWQVAS